MTRKPHLTQQAHTLIREHFENLDKRPTIAIDATCGNGFDTMFLAKLVSEKVFAFDVQEIALEKTRQQLEQSDLESKVELIHSGHENMADHVNSPVDVIMFNLGYLPQADKSLTTQTESTLVALNSSLKLLSPNGILSILCYPGHAEGKRETCAVRDTLEGISDEYKIEEIEANYPNEKSPVLLLVTCE